MKLEYGQYFPHDEREYADLHLKSEGGGGKSQIKTKVKFGDVYHTR